MAEKIDAKKVHLRLIFSMWFILSVVLTAVVAAGILHSWLVFVPSLFLFGTGSVFLFYLIKSQW